MLSDTTPTKRCLTQPPPNFRYLCRTLCPDLYPNDVIRATEVDSLLDLAESLINASARNQKPALKQANQVLGKVRARSFSNR